VTKRATVPVATATAAATPKPAAPAAAPPAAQPGVAPVVHLSAKPAPAKTAASASQPIDKHTLAIAGGGLLALLALVGIASVLIGRRRSRREKELADAQVLAYEPFETAAAPEHAAAVHHEEPATASAFAWGNQAQTDAPARADERTADGDDRRPGESWVERAYRGPSTNNPSVSLRTRLKRAAFFDKREREAAAGTAEPVDATAGLPDAMIEEQEREMA
jgi:hypothetical protein